MDFIDGLPISQGKSIILVAVDRISNYAHFIALSHPYIVLFVAQLFMDHIYQLHGLLKSIISDKGPLFVNNFWGEFFTV